jgi:hypothetical protein
MREGERDRERETESASERRQELGGRRLKYVFTCRQNSCRLRAQQNTIILLIPILITTTFGCRWRVRAHADKSPRQHHPQQEGHNGSCTRTHCRQQQRVPKLIAGTQGVPEATRGGRQAAQGLAVSPSLHQAGAGV